VKYKVSTVFFKYFTCFFIVVAYYDQTTWWIVTNLN